MLRAGIQLKSMTVRVGPREYRGITVAHIGSRGIEGVQCTLKMVLPKIPHSHQTRYSHVQDKDSIDMHHEDRNDCYFLKHTYA